MSHLTETPTSQHDSVLTIGAVAHELGVEARQVRSLFIRGILPEPRRLGPMRVFDREQLPAIRQALTAAGYITSEPEA